MKVFDFHIHVGNDTKTKDILAFLDETGIEKGFVSLVNLMVG
jgi:hypothetical protein